MQACEFLIQGCESFIQVRESLMQPCESFPHLCNLQSASAWSGDGSTCIIRRAGPDRYTQPCNASPQGDDEYIKEQTP
jgi:hypothetical protein